MIVVSVRAGSLAGMIRHKRVVVREGQHNEIDERDPDVRELLLKHAGANVFVRAKHATLLAAVGLELQQNGRVVDIAKATKKEPPKSATK